jgi:hypothetical protein
MAVVAERTVTESIDDLVREAETLKVRLEEERAKFNDMECKNRHQHCLFTFFRLFFFFLLLFVDVNI